MKKLLILLFLFSGLLHLVQAKPVNLDKAKAVGAGFLSTIHSGTMSKGFTLDLVYTATAGNSNPNSLDLPTTYFYVFNVNGTDGFVLVSADDIVTPVLGYSDEKAFDAANVPPSVAKWLENYKAQIRYAISNKLEATQEIKEEWDALSSGGGNETFGQQGVAPLVQTKWDQSPYYNSLCPYDNQEGERTVTGCVATAMAQVMKFWNYPASGTGYHSYNHSSYGTVSANFGSTTYQWGSMPTQVNSTNTAVATLMYHCGVSVDMNYDVASNGGSGAYVISAASAGTNCAEYAFKTYFGYKTSLSGISRSDYTQTQWINTIKSELDGGRPVLYAGYGSGGGHAFVCDGYDNSDYFHFNWGWGGAYDGYFAVNALNPGGVGTGGGTGGFNSNHQAVIGIEPVSGGSGTPVLDMRLYSSIYVSPNPIEYSAPFTISVDFVNYGTSSADNFNGDYAAAIFTADNVFVDYVEIKTGLSLPFNSHYINPIEFNSSGMSSLTPGMYKVGMYYRPTGVTEWTAFANGNYQNFVTVEVKGNDNNPLKLYAPITTNPAVIVRNQTFSVHFDLANYDNFSFNGSVSVDLHKSDGTWIRELQVQNSLSLPAQSHFTNGITFTITGGLPEEAGTYQLFVWDKPTGGDWEFVGTGNYSNPINIQVVEPGLAPDAYEINNSSGTAYQFPVSFSGSNATVVSTGSNCHKGNDYDYYKINLPPGYNYSIVSRIHDAYSAANGNTYTLDGMFSYSTDGTSWSDVFDDVMQSAIQLNGGGTVYFLVSPFFTGETGTYLLDLKISRTAVSLSSQKEITGFSVPNMVGTATINSANATVKLTINESADIKALTPTVAISPFAAINPISGNAQDFSNPVNYTVTAQDNSTKVWTVTVTQEKPSAMKEMAENTVQVYPNPANGFVKIVLADANHNGLNCELADMQGKVVKDFNINKGTTAYECDLSDISEGVYLLRINSSGEITNRKIVIRR